MDTKVDKYISEHPEQHYIVDNCHSFYHKPNVGGNYIYSCRKFFGVPDGAYLITNAVIASQPRLVCNAKQAGYLLTCLEEGTNACYQGKRRWINILQNDMKECLFWRMQSCRVLIMKV